MNKTVVKVGRQYFDKPLMSSDNHDVIKQAIEGVTIVSNDIPDTTLYAAYAWRMSWMKDNGVNNDFANFGKFGLLYNVIPGAEGGDYAYVVGAINKSLPDTTLTLAYGEEDKSHSLFLAQADYMPKINDSVTLVTGLQFWNTELDERSVAWADSTVYSAKLGLNVGPVGAYVAYAKINDGRGAWGVGMTDDRPRLYTSTLTDAGQFEASTQYAVDVHAFVPQIATVLGVRYVNIDLDEKGAASSQVGIGKIDQTGFYAIHNFSGSLKGLYCMGFYEIANNSNDAYSRDEIRFRVGYEF
nr:OprD family outer membrane porin [Sulfurospirillum diekertiae]